MKKKIIVFDLDGVLFDSSTLVSDFLTDWYPSLTKKNMNEMLTGNFHEEMEKFKATNKPIQETPAEKQIRTAAYSAKKSQAPLFDGIRELLESLYEKGFILTINTSALEKNCLPLLDFSGIRKFFDFLGTKEVSTNKAEKLKMIAEKYSVSNEDMLFITDTLGDVREADTAHVPTVAVTWGAHDRSYFAREPHKNLVAILDTVGELESFIMNHF